MNLLRVKHMENFYLRLYFILTSPLFQIGSSDTRDSEELSLSEHVNCDAGATRTRSDQVQVEAGIVM